MQTLDQMMNQLKDDERITGIIEYAEDLRKEYSSLSDANYSHEATLVWGLISAASSMSLGLFRQDPGTGFFPENWIDTNHPNSANSVMGCMLCQLANYSYGTFQLTRQGLDVPARALLRSTIELSFMIVIVASDRDVFNRYVCDDDSHEKQIWYELFSERKLASKLEKIHQELGLPPSWRQKIKEYRHRVMEFYSQATHHSATAVTVGNLPTQPNIDRVELAILGGYPAGTKATISDLVFSINYALTMLLNSRNLRLSHSPDECYFWKNGRSLFDSIQPAIYSWQKAAK